jgi:hypothetical protein
MKTKLERILTLFCLAALIVSSCLWTGCSTTGKTSLLGSVKQVIVGDDYEAAGRAVGEAGYMAYVVLKGDKKYAKYTDKCEELYAALDNAESETVKLGTINQVALEVMQVALTAKYGYAKASLITTGVRIGGAVADRIIAKKVDTIAADKFVKGFKEGIDEAKGAALPAVVTDTTKAPKYITCQKGQKCQFTFTNRSTAVQLEIAKELDDYGFLDKTEVRTDPYIPTKAENVADLIKKLEKMRELGEETSIVWIAEVRINENGKLDSIKFLYEEADGEIKETNCVSCVN